MLIIYVVCYMCTNRFGWQNSWCSHMKVNSRKWLITWCYYVKSVQIQSFFWSVFYLIRTECGEMRSNVGKYGPEKTPYLDTFLAVAYLPNVASRYIVRFHIFCGPNKKFYWVHLSRIFFISHWRTLKVVRLILSLLVEDMLKGGRNLHHKFGDFNTLLKSSHNLKFITKKSEIVATRHPIKVLPILKWFISIKVVVIVFSLHVNFFSSMSYGCPEIKFGSLVNE